MEHRITVFAGPASSQLGAAVCNALQVAPGLYGCRRFPDGKAQIDVHESVRGHDTCCSPPARRWIKSKGSSRCRSII
jgi:phosphoribosylpyrophosphate synthetase